MRRLWVHLATLTTLCVSLAASCATVPAATHKTPGTWTLGAPIVTYWAGPGTTMAVDDAAAARLRAGGWNLGWAARPEDLDILHRHGLRAIPARG